MERQAREAGVSAATRFLGVVPRDELPNLYASADLFLMPSTTETQGLVLAEALAAGAFVIAADAPQNREVLGNAGRVVDPTAEAFAEAFQPMANGSRSDAREARTAALAFSIERQVDRMQALYESLVRPARIA